MKKWSTLSVRPSSYGCTREAAKHERSVRVTLGYASCDSSFLSAKQPTKCIHNSMDAQLKRAEALTISFRT